MKFFAAIGLSLFAGLLIVLSGLIRAWVGITLYRWFALPLGLPDISMGQLFGLMYLIGVVWQITPDKSDKKKDEAESLGDSIVNVLISLAGSAAFPLLFGWIIKLIIS